MAKFIVFFVARFNWNVCYYSRLLVIKLYNILVIKPFFKLLFKRLNLLMIYWYKLLYEEFVVEQLSFWKSSEGLGFLQSSHQCESTVWLLFSHHTTKSSLCKIIWTVSSRYVPHVLFFQHNLFQIFSQWRYSYIKIHDRQLAI